MPEIHDRRSDAAGKNGESTQAEFSDVEGERLFHEIRARLFARDGTFRVGRYRISKLLGAGAMGEVHLATDDDLGRSVAIKFVHSRHGDSRWAQRLRLEAQALARLAHPNVVHVYEVGEHEGRVYLAMEYIDGGSLRDWLRAKPGPAWAEVLAAYLEAARGLSAAHSAGIVHRDFKPDNILRGRDGRVAVSDFGLAELEEVPDLHGDSGSMPPGEFAGTPAYMPLEQFHGHADGRSDQFSLGVSLYEGLWGRRPFDGISLARVLRGEASWVPAPPPEASEVPRWIWPLLRRVLSFDPEDRFASVDELIAALEGGLRIRRRRGRLLRSGLAALAFGALSGGTAWWGGSSLGASPPPCSIDESVLAGTWGEPQRIALREAFAETGLGYAEASASVVEEHLGAWARAWTDQRRQACEATKLEEVSSEAELELRIGCLDRQRQSLDALVGTFVVADADVIVRASALVAELPDLRACADLRALSAASALPRGRETEVLAGYQLLERAKAMTAARRLGAANGLLAELAAALPTLDHPPLAIEYRAARASASFEGGSLSLGLEGMREAVLEAAGSELDELEANLRVELAHLAAGRWSKPEIERFIVEEAAASLARSGRPGDPREALVIRAQAALAREAGEHRAALALLRTLLVHSSGPPPRPHWRATVHTEIANELAVLGEYEEAEQEYRAALAMLREQLSDAHPRVARIEFDLALLALDRGQLDRASKLLASARSIYVDTFGNNSLKVARVDLAAASVAIQEGEFDRGLELSMHAEVALERDLGPEHAEVGDAAEAVGILRYYQGDFAGSIMAYRRALAIRERALGPKHESLALLRSNLGESLLALDPESNAPEALDAFNRAVASLESTLGPSSPYLLAPLKGRGQASLALGNPRAAVQDLERALAVSAGTDALLGEVGDARLALARALLIVGERREQVWDLAKKGVDELTRAGRHDLADEGLAWIATIK